MWAADGVSFARKHGLTAPEAYRTLVKNRVSQKRWHVAQVFERGLVNALR
jgi:hypothetical protein